MVPGGDLYPTLIRKTPIKPIRIFMQDGSHDLDNAHGNWFLANQQMLTAFPYATRAADAKDRPGPRYEVRHEWGEGAHSDDHGGAIPPDILRKRRAGQPVTLRGYTTCCAERVAYGRASGTGAEDGCWGADGRSQERQHQRCAAGPKGPPARP